MAEAIKPITGITPQQFSVAVRRQPLTPEAKVECARLDAALEKAEAAHGPAGPKTKTDEQLFLLRKRYRELQC
jgi:hypothetical protein